MRTAIWVAGVGLMGLGLAVSEPFLVSLGRTLILGLCGFMIGERWARGQV